MEKMRSTLKEHFGRRMRPEVSQLPKGEIRVSIAVERLRLTPHQLELAERHHEACRVHRGNLILEGERDKVVSCIEALAKDEKSNDEQRHVAREGRRRRSRQQLVMAKA